MPPCTSTPVIETRAAMPVDIPLLRDLAERIWRVSYAEVIPAEQVDYMLAWMYGPEKIAQELEDGVVWEIAMFQDEPVGFLSIGLDEDPTHAKLHKLYLLPERQGQGFGQALMERAHQIAEAFGATAVRLQVNKQNVRGIRAYERAGYIVERSDVFDIGRGFVMDDFIMRRPLKSLPAA